MVQPKPDGSLRVIIQGFMKARFVPGRHVTLDGFYKHPDGTASATSASVEPGFSYRNSWATKGVVGLKSLERRDDWMDFAGDRSNATDSETLTAISPYYLTDRDASLGSRSNARR
jgi:hypothetical protein